MADGRPEAAQQGVTNLLALAVASGQRSLQAESVAFEAGVLERLNRPDEAIAAYEKNLAVGLPGERRREALLKIISLSLARNKISETVLRLEKLLGQFPKDEAADAALADAGRTAAARACCRSDSRRHQRRGGGHAFRHQPAAAGAGLCLTRW